MQIRKPLLLILSILAIVSCDSDTVEISNTETLPNFQLISPAKSKITFENKVAESVNRNFNFYEYFYNGAGVAFLDIDNDGLQDLFFAGNDVDNKLYLNKGGMEFEDISISAGITGDYWATGVTIIDINEDGYDDIYVCSSGPDIIKKDLRNKLYVNNGNMTFSEKSKEYGIDDNSFSSHAVFFDYDNDSDLDLLVTNHAHFKGDNLKEADKFITEQGDDYIRRASLTLYENENNRFRDVSEEKDLIGRCYALSASVADFDDDGDLDVYIANDYYVPDFYLVNDGNKGFTENIKQHINHTSFFGMGSDAADINNDGLIDLMVVDMSPSDHVRNKTLMASMNTNYFKLLTQKIAFIPQYMFNTFQLNRGNGQFSEIANGLGLALSDWSWSILMADFNNSGWKDIYVTNGFRRDTKNNDWKNNLKKRTETDLTTNKTQIVFEELLKAPSTRIPNQLYQNHGNLNFTNSTTSWNLEEKSFSNGAAYGDLDNDGDLDLVVNNLESKAFIYENNARQNGGNYIQLELIDAGKKSSVLNSRITVYTDEGIQTADYSFYRGYMSTMQELIHFGIGTEKSVVKLEILWPDHSISIINSPDINTKHVIDKSQIARAPQKANNNTIPNFYDISSQAKNMKFKHSENEFDDFETEILLPHKQSTLGPALATGDFNGDNLEDFYVGGAKGQAGQVFVQTAAEGFIPLENSVVESDKNYEDLGAIVFDFDNDGDHDLYVASGGGGDISKESLLQDRIYVNDGSGNFSKGVGILPKITSSTRAIAPYDWDGDGDVDLFIGGRNVPSKYPEAPMSYFLENKDGKYIDVTDEIADGLSNLGMVTTAEWINTNGDDLSELVLIGEWMPVTILTIQDGKIINKTNETGLSESQGWWYSMASGDFDNDGDVDLVVGNLGKNNKFHPSVDKPFHLYSKDFDGNGTRDIVLSKEYKGELVPVRGKECSSQQMPFIKDKFPTYEEFATSSMLDIYGEENLAVAEHLLAKTFSHHILLNDGSGNFQQLELPQESQMSIAMGIVAHDFDKDGNLDLILGGNEFNTEVETPAYDAGRGLYLKGNGDGTFQPRLDNSKIGFDMKGNAKHVNLIGLTPQKNPAILVANNNGPLQLYAYTK